MPVSTSLVNSVGVISAFNQSAQISVNNAVSSASVTRTSTTSNNIINTIDYNISQKREQIDFFLDKTIITDGEKIDLDDAIKRMDVSILTEIENVNDKLKALRTAYQNRIDAGVATDLFWRVVSKRSSIDSNGPGVYGPFAYNTVTTYQLKCVKTTPNGYTPISVSGTTSYSTLQLFRNYLYGEPLPPLDDGTMLQYITTSGISKVSIKNFPPFGFASDNYYGIKYYEHPYSVDILDSYVSGFTGSIGLGSTVLYVNQLLDSGVASRIRVGQNIICNKENVFPSGNEIVGIGTTVVNLDYSTQKVPATAVSSVSSGVVTSITTVNPGLGYTSDLPPDVIIQPPNANVAIGTAVVSAAGTISSIQVSNPGTGYTVAPTVTISAPYVESATGYGLTGIGGTITNVVMLTGGFYYTSAPTVLFENPPVIGVGVGTTATGTANIGAGGTITSVTITNAGYGYTSNPAVSFTNPGFTTATATASISSFGSVNSVTITNPGVGYTNFSEYLPEVTFSSPIVVGASATSSVSIAGTVTSINITNPGLGYTFNPSVTIEFPYNDVIPVLYLENSSSDSASYPESDGSFVTFSVLSSSEDITSIASTTVAISFGLNPFSPESIGIMKSTQTGIGVSIKYDNSGYPDAVQTWRPELESDEVVVDGRVVYAAVKEPVVGSGKIFYNLGFDNKPRYPTNGSYTAWRDAVEGDTLTLIYTSGVSVGLLGITNPPSLTNFITPCDPDTAGYGTSITNAQNIVNTAKSNIAAGISLLNQKISVSNILRKQRNDYNIQIWGNRQLIGRMLEEIDEFESARSSLNNSGISSILDG